MFKHTLRNLIALVCLCGLLVWSGDDHQSPAAERPAVVKQAQANAFLQFGKAATKDEEGTSGVNLPTNRRIKRDLEAIAELIEAGRFGEVTSFLGEILGGTDTRASEDAFFTADEARSHYKSLKAEARRILGSLPEKGRETYELQFGARAKKMLATALETGDVGMLTEVSWRFFHTKAGYEATVLLGQHHLDHHRPLAAALAYQQVLDVPREAQRFEPNLSIWAAVSWRGAGIDDHAQKILVNLKKRYPNATLQVAGRDVPLFSHDDEAIAWLDRQVGKAPDVGGSQGDSWTMYRGNGGRNAASDGGRPLLEHRWRARLAIDHRLERLVESMQDAYVRQDVAMIPSLHPLAIDDVIVMRTARRLYGVDFKTGKLIWEVQPAPDDTFERLIQSGQQQSTTGQLPQLAQGLEQRMWDDATFGTLSSDGERVYAVQDLELTTANYYATRMFFAPRPQMTSGPRTYNRLSALDLRTEGKLVWDVGGPSSEEEELSDAFFLGPPLPISGRLYVLAEIKGGIRLVVLDAKTGKLDWSQQLADVEHNVVIDPFRRLAGAVPSFTDGVLVCPTSAGAVVAVDLSTRSLLWAFTYPQERNTRHNRLMMMRGYRTNQKRSNDRWIDASATIVDQRVLLTPPEAGKLFCLNLIDGKLEWSIDRDESLYVACVHNDKVILVGPKQLTAVQLSDGKNAWSKTALPLPKGSLPSGRGYYCDKYYYLPLSSAEVAKIDLDDARIVDRAKSRDRHVPGNLICHRGEVVSQGVDVLETYYQIESLESQVAAALKKNPEDPKALARRGQLLFDQGKLNEAIADFRSSFKLDPNALTRDLLIRSLLAGLHRDFSANRMHIAEIEQLIDQPETQLALLYVKADGLHKSGEHAAAVENYLRLVELQRREEDSLRDVDDHWSVRKSRWIQAQLADLYTSASNEARAAIDTAVEARVAKIGGDAKPAELRELLDYFGSQPQAEAVRQQLVDRLLENNSRLESQLLLDRLVQSDVPAIRAEAVAQMAMLLRKAGQVHHAAKYYKRLKHEFADVVCLDSKTGQELAAALPATDPVARQIAGGDAWPTGEVRVSTHRPSSSSQSRRRTYPIPLEGDLGSFYEDVTLAFDQQLQTVVGYDGLGARRFGITLAQSNVRRGMLVNPSLNYGAALGHLLVISSGTQVFAIDTLNTQSAGAQNVLWRQDVVQQVPGVNFNPRVQPKRVVKPGGLTRFRADDGQGHALGVIGPVLPEGIAFQRFRDLVCVDVLSGETHWVRHDLPIGCDLFGDREMLFAVHPASKKATVVRTLDGALLGTREVPMETERMATLGRRVLSWSATQGRQVLSLVDPWEEKTLWKHDFAAGSHSWLVEDDVIGVLEPSGKFALIALPDGQPVVEDQLLAEPGLSGIFLFRSQAQYLLITNHPAANPQPGVSISAAPGGFHNPLISGRIYALDRKTGQQQWAMPASFDQHGLLIPQHTELPVLCLVRHMVNTKSSNRRTNTSVLCIDKRTGRKVYQKDDFSFNTSYYNINADATRKTVTLTMPTMAITMTYTAAPIPPEPPLQAGTVSVSDGGEKGIFRIFGAIPKALGKAVERAAGDRVQVDRIREDERDEEEP